MGPNLSNWPRITNRLPDRDPARHLGRGPRGSVAWNLGQLIDGPLFLFGTAGGRRRKSLILALGMGLSRKTSTEKKLINGHLFSFHHIFALTDLCI